MQDKILKRIAALISVKSLVTLTLTAVVAYMAIAGKLGEAFLENTFLIIIAFYFGTQSQKIQDAIDGGEKDGN